MKAILKIIQDHGLSILEMPARLLMAPVKNKFLIFCRGRSGSTLLYHLLNQHPQINCQGELLHSYSYTPKLRIKYYESRNRDYCFGFKLLTYQCTDVFKLKDVGAFLNYFHQNGYRIIYLERTNLVKQAISNISAFQNRQFQSTAKVDQITIAPEKLKMWLDILQNRKKIETEALKNLPFLHLNFENQLHRAQAHQDTINQICEYLELPHSPIQSPNTKIIKAPLPEYLNNYEALRAMLKGSPYEEQLKA